MKEGAETKTSQINANEFETYFEKYLRKERTSFMSASPPGISGVVNSARIAKAELEARYPDRKIFIVDSLGASSGYGLLMDKLADLRDGGKIPSGSL